MDSYLPQTSVSNSTPQSRLAGQMNGDIILAYFRRRFMVYKQTERSINFRPLANKNRDYVFFKNMNIL